MWTWPRRSPLQALWTPMAPAGHMYSAEVVLSRACWRARVCRSAGKAESLSRGNASKELSQRDDHGARGTWELKARRSWTDWPVHMWVLRVRSDLLPRPSDSFSPNNYWTSGKIQINNNRSEKGDITTDTTEIKRILRKCSEQLYARGLGDLEEMDESLETHKVPRHMHEK